MKHYIEMSGSHGCLPDHCDVTFDHNSAVESLACIFDFDDKAKAELADNDYMELMPEDGAQYCEITDCDCSEPWIHSDAYSSEEEFKLNYPEQFEDEEV